MRWVPVWQKVQPSVQPTWDEMQSAPRRGAAYGGHRGKLGDAAMVDPVPEPLGPHAHPLRRHADGEQALREFVAAEPDQAFPAVSHGVDLAVRAAAGVRPVRPRASLEARLYGHALTMAS